MRIRTLTLALAASAGIVAAGWQAGAAHEVAVARAGSGGSVPASGDGAGSSAAASGSYQGQTVQTRYGPVQVQVTVSDGKIIDVAALQLPQDDGHSARISSAVEPMLRAEVLSAQSADIQTISGATYTSEAYASSLQSALDNAR